MLHQLKRFGKLFTEFETKLDIGSLFEAHFFTDEKNILTFETL